MLESQHQFIIPNLLPSLIVLLQSPNGDTRFLALKIFTDIIGDFLKQPSIYNVSWNQKLISLGQLRVRNNKATKRYYRQAVASKLQENLDG